MSASDDGPDGQKELYRRGVAFLYRARDLPELSNAQVDRIERRLNRGAPRARRPILSPVLAALVIVLLAGGAVAVAGKRLARLPGFLTWVGAIWTPRPTPGTTTSPTTTTTTTTASRRTAARRVTGVGDGAVRGSPPLSAELPAVPTNRAPAFRWAAASAPSTESATRTPARVRRRQPEANVASTVAAPAARREPAQATPAPPPIAGGSSFDTGESHVTGPAPTPRLAPAASAPAASAPPILGREQSSPAVGSPLPASPSFAAPSSTTPSSTTPSSTTPSLAVPSPAAPRESSITAESRSFSAALESWHRDHDATTALALLDAHERRFPHGQIRLESQLLRAEILLARGREREALALLDPLALAGLPRARELQTVRGELRIKLGRCAEGKADLGTVLTDGVSDALAKRARRALLDCP